MAKILDAQPIYDELKDDLRRNVAVFGKRIGLASLVVGTNYSSRVYLASQERFAHDINVDYCFVELDPFASEQTALGKIKQLNADSHIAGIITNKPFPTTWCEQAIFSAIARAKDIEGVTPHNLGLICLGEPAFISPTALSVLEFLKQTKIDLYGKEVVIVGFSTIIGKPLALLLAHHFATVTVTHVATYEAERLPFYIENADVVISAVGKPALIKGAWIKKGAIVIDVGTGERDGKIAGDIEFEEAAKRASFITPVPGGVGRLTTLFLFKNLLKAATGIA